MRILLLTTLFIATLMASYKAPMEVKGSLTIDSKATYGLYNKGAKFLDVRPMRFVKDGKIKGAIHLYVGDFTKEKLLKIIKLDEEVVVYCNGQSCSLTAEAIIEMLKYGYTKIYYYRDGYPAWKYYQLPME
ncbi:MAG: rhodanese-like domain-containing protein [Campylobacterota bacterium]|nr:rhodanese-like domain-containing protein [Campylobacterota bacterium]